MRLRSTSLAVGLAVLLLAGCGNDPQPPDPSELPEGAISLTMNAPNRFSVEGLTVVAFNIDGSGASLTGWGPSGGDPETGGRVEIGDTINIEGTTLRLVATWVDPDPPEGVGDRSEAWVVVEE